VPLERLVVEHLLQEADDLRAGGVADEVHRVLLVPHRVVSRARTPCRTGSADMPGCAPRRSPPALLSGSRTALVPCVLHR
jgi:hypothetical protein